MGVETNQYIEWQWPKYTISYILKFCPIRSIKATEMIIVSAFIILELHMDSIFVAKRRTLNMHEVWCFCKMLFLIWFMSETNSFPHTHTNVILISCELFNSWTQVQPLHSTRLLFWYVHQLRTIQDAALVNESSLYIWIKVPAAAFHCSGTRFRTIHF